MGLFRRWKCEHEYQKIDTEVRDYGLPAIYYILYCPKCDKEKAVNAERYNRELMKEEMRTHYSRKG